MATSFMLTKCFLSAVIFLCSFGMNVAVCRMFVNNLDVTGLVLFEHLSAKLNP